ncbi:MAG: hypothetical protein AAFY72_07420 [Cyanobacteria bacterium J06649_4]
MTRFSSSFSIRHRAALCGKFTMHRGGYSWADVLALTLMSCLFVVASQRSAQGQSSLRTSVPNASVSSTSLVVDSHMIESQAHYIFSMPNADIEHQGASGAVLIYTQDETALEPTSEMGLSADFSQPDPFGSSGTVNVEQLGLKPVGVK